MQQGQAELAEKIHAFYPENGFVFPLELFSCDYFAQHDIIGCFRRFYQRARAADGAERPELPRLPPWSELRFKSHMYLPWLHRMLFDSEHNGNLRVAARALLQCEDVVVWSTDWCVKRAGAPVRFSWHQDSTYSRISGAQGTTIWLAFSHVSEEHGPLLFRPGTHKMGQFFHYETADDGENLLAFGQTIPGPPASEGASTAEQAYWKNLSPEQQRWVGLPVVAGVGLRPGLASAHSFELVHSSQANCAASARVGLAVRLLRADAARLPGANWRNDRVALLCGDERKVQGFELEHRPPREEFGEAEMVEWRRSLDRETEIYFGGVLAQPRTAEGDSSLTCAKETCSGEAAARATVATYR